jgi:hypothetical protein
MKTFFLEMYSRLTARNAKTALASNIAIGQNARTASTACTPVEVATQMRLQGPTRIQEHDFLHVFETTVKPEISGPLAIGKLNLINSSILNVVKEEN